MLHFNKNMDIQMFQEAHTPRTNNLVAGYILSNINTYKLFKAGNNFFLTQERVNQFEALSFDCLKSTPEQKEEPISKE